MLKVLQKFTRFALLIKEDRMNTTLDALHGRGEPLGTAEAKRVTVGAGIGAAIEVYDFIGFGIAAALYLGAAFFPGNDPATATLLAFGTLGVGFGVRPIGGLLAGMLGDRIGRKPVLVISLIMMGTCTVIMGLLPTYAQIGVLAPILLVVARVIQGLAFGAEWGGAVLMTYEHAPIDKKGRNTGFMHAGFAAGLLLANLAFLATAPLGNDWSWRIPFLASVLLVVAGFIIRSKLGESPTFTALRNAGTRSRTPIRDVFLSHPKQIVAGICLRIAEPAGYALAVTYMISYLHNNDLANDNTTLFALLIASVLGIAATPLWGMLTDKIGRRPLFMAACLFGIVMAVPMFLMANTGSVILVGIIMILAYTVFQNALVASQGTLLPELFAPEIRFTGASMSYQISAAISGFTPFVATALSMSFGWMGAAALLAAVCVISLIAVSLIPESWSAAHRAAGEQLKQEALAAAGNGDAAPVQPAAQQARVGARD